MRVLSVIGTRPEAVKMAPVVAAQVLLVLMLLLRVLAQAVAMVVMVCHLLFLVLP